MGAAACSAAVTVWCSRTPAAKKTTAEMTVELWGRSLRLKALLDSGNDLRDPLTSRPVVVLSRSEFAALLPPEYTAFLTDDPVESFGIFQQTPHGKSFRILSYKALGVESALLLAVRSDAVTVGPRRREGLLVACAPGEISEHGGYTALAGTEV